MLPMKILIKSMSLCTLKLFTLFHKLHVEEKGHLMKRDGGGGE